MYYLACLPDEHAVKLLIGKTVILEEATAQLKAYFYAACDDEERMKGFIGYMVPERVQANYSPNLSQFLSFAKTLKAFQGARITEGGDVIAKTPARKMEEYRSLAAKDYQKQLKASLLALDGVTVGAHNLFHEGAVMMQRYLRQLTSAARSQIRDLVTKPEGISFRFSSLWSHNQFEQSGLLPLVVFYHNQR